MFERILKGQRGAFMVFFAILVPLFLGMIGFAVDAGFIYMQKAKMQDIADAAALAGAGHLQDDANMRESNIRLAVSAYAEENGLKAGTGTSENLVYWENNTTNTELKLTKYDKWKMGQVIQYGVTDKDGKQRDHVKVVIAKRVPTFFINILFPDQKDGVVVKVAAAAEYVEGEEAPVSYNGPKIMTGNFNYLAYNSDSIKVKSGEDFTIYGGGEQFDYNKLPKVSNSIIFSPHGKRDDEIPDGWTLIRTSQDQWNLDDPKEKAKKEALDSAKQLFENKNINHYNKMKEIIADRESYIRGDSYELNGKRIYKRYIGLDSQWKSTSNIVGNEGTIDLYLDASDVNNLSNNGYVIILTNRQLKGIKNVHTLIFGNASNGWGKKVIATNGVTYGNIYNSVTCEMSITGDNNHFNGLIYTPGNILYIGGENNYYNETNSTEIFSYHDWGQVVIGVCIQIKENVSDDGESNLTLGNVTSGNDPNWHMYWGGSGSSGSSDSGDDTQKAHVRLVE